MRPIPKLTEVHHYPVVAGVALLAIGVTAAWWAKMDISPLFATGMIRRGQLWLLVTSILPHGGVLHLLFNVYWLWVFGTTIEDAYGHLKTAALILLFAAGSSALEFAFLDGGIGLSGVGYGLFGLLWILSLHGERFRDAIDRRTIEVFVVWFFICIGTTLTKIMPIANIAHGAGAVLGIVTGYAITRPTRRVAATAGVGVILLFSLWAATFGRPRVNLSSRGGYDEAQWGYGALMSHRDQEAVRWFREAIVYKPNEPAFWFDLAIAHYNTNDRPAAIAAYYKAAELGETNASYYLAKMYEEGAEGLPKDDAQALLWYRKAADHGHADALNDLAWLYATSRDPAIRNPVAALEYARKAVSLDREKADPSHLDTLAEAYYVNEKFEEAVQTEQQALSMVPEEHRTDYQKNLEKYRRALHSKHKVPTP
jgi:membrane associated rhomboid family serine protease/TPR repeat protein